MKKLKLLLSAAVVVATVSGALAFKAHTFSTDYCTATTSGNCQGSFTGAQEGTPGTTYFTKTTTSPSTCGSQSGCTTQRTLKAE